MMQSSKTQSFSLLKLIILALLGTISLVLFFINFPLPFLPTPYLKIDFSEVPALMAAFIFSPLAGVIVVAIKNVLYLAIGGGEIIGVLANFLTGVLFIVPVALMYHKFKGVKSVISGLVTGTIVMALGMSVLNYFLILPAYGWFMGWEMTEQFKWFSVYAGILPFNLIKGIVVGLLFVPLFLKMRQWIEEKRASLI